MLDILKVKKKRLKYQFETSLKFFFNLLTFCNIYVNLTKFSELIKQTIFQYPKLLIINT